MTSLPKVFSQKEFENAVHDKIKFNGNFCKESYSEKKELRAHVKAVNLPTKENN